MFNTTAHSAVSATRSSSKHLITTNARALRGQAAPLYERYQSQTKAQRARIYITPGAFEAIAEVDGCINMTPMDVATGRHVEVTISNTLSGPEIADFLEARTTQKLVERICLGHAVEWNGSNMIGVLDDDATAALEGLESAAAELQGSVQVWDVADYLTDVHGITATTTDAQLRALADELTDDARAEGITLQGSVYKCLQTLRDAA